jgi:hypothetical protein
VVLVFFKRGQSITPLQGTGTETHLLKLLLLLLPLSSFPCRRLLLLLPLNLLLPLKFALVSQAPAAPASQVARAAVAAPKFVLSTSCC